MSEHEYHFEFFAKLAGAEKRARSEAKVEGKAEGKAESILMLLDGRRVRMPARIRERILGCTDLDQLDHWFRAAITARTIDDLFPRKTPAAA